MPLSSLPRRPLAIVVAVAALLGALAAVGMRAAAAPTPATPARPAVHAAAQKVTAPAMPAQMLGLDVKQEKTPRKLSGSSDPPYFDAMWLYSLRDDAKGLQAILEVGHFNADAQVGSTDFQQRIAQQIGSTSALRQLRFGADRVDITSNDQLTVAVWFKGRDIFILTVRDTYTQPKSLVRAALGLKP
jgi:hypothetical protein